MIVDFVRFKATDDVEIQGWLSNVDSETAVIHLHGKSGNGYENSFLDSLRALYSDKNISFLTIDTRGRGVISDFRQGIDTKHAGSCFELFEESEYDIQGAVNYMRSIGKKRFILQGHSLGCTKIVNYVSQNSTESIEKIILLAPTDMSAWAESHAIHAEYLQTAKKLITEGNPTGLVGAQCWTDKEPLSAQTYLSICERGSKADIYSDREGGSLLGRIKTPTLIVYGDQDIGIKQVDGSIDNWTARTSNTLNPATKVSVIEGAGHSFGGYEDRLSEIIARFV